LTVYVDDMRATVGRMKLCHMIADTPAELLEMVDRIGVNRRWIQDAGSYREHFDVSLGKRQLAVAYGAREVSQLELGRIIRQKRTGGK
jgi:hypothetical protein